MKEKIQKRLQQLFEEREKAQVAVLNYNGAIAILQQMLQEEEAKPEQTSQEKVTKAQLPKLINSKPKVITVVPEQVS